MESAFCDTPTGLRTHFLQMGDPGAPVLLLLHGFPELAYSWRRIAPILAGAGYRVVAPDQRGFGQTTGGDARYEADLSAFGMPALARDAMALLHALGIERVKAAIGHDFGAPVAAWCALIRPDVFPAVAAMSAPFAGPPDWPDPGGAPDINADLAALTPPRRHYQHWFAEPGANEDMLHAPQGLRAFLRAYFHCKSGDWPGNRPHPLASSGAGALAEMPRYYIMDKGVGMAATAASMAPTPEEAAACAWLTEAELDVYAAEYGRTGFQGGLNWYRRAISPEGVAELRLFAGRRIEVPATFIAGARDWGARQVPGALEAMETRATGDWRGAHAIPGAGHWVQQEAPEATAEALLAFLRGL